MKAKPVKKGRRRKKSDLPPPPEPNARILDAVKAKGFTGRKAFADYLADRGKKGKTLVQMAKELRIPAPTFIGYHAEYIDSLARPLRVDG